MGKWTEEQAKAMAKAKANENCCPRCGSSHSLVDYNFRECMCTQCGIVMNKIDVEYGWYMIYINQY